MKSVTLLYDVRGFQSAEAPGRFFSKEEFREECIRQNLLGSQEILLRVVLHVQRFIVIPLCAKDDDFFACHFPSHGALSSCHLNDGLQKMVYEVPESLNHYLHSVLPRCFIVPDCALMARYALDCSRSNRSLENSEAFVVYCSDESNFKSDDTTALAAFSIFIARNGQLTFANAFQTRSFEDVRYFVMAVKQKFSQGTRCLLCSDGGSLLSIKEMLHPFFESIEEISLAASHSEPFMALFSDIIL